MPLIAFAQTLQNSALGVALREASPPVILAIQLTHVLGLVLLLTTLLLVNLRLLGLGLARLPLQELVRATRWSLRLGLALAIVSGTLLYLSAPVSYIANAAFVPKMLLLAAALVVQASLYRIVTVRAHVAPLLARSTAVLSLSLWFSVGLAGRAIGFV
jgi:hypothetical protein